MCYSFDYSPILCVPDIFHVPCYFIPIPFPSSAGRSRTPDERLVITTIQ